MLIAWTAVAPPTGYRPVQGILCWVGTGMKLKFGLVQARYKHHPIPKCVLIHTQHLARQSEKKWLEGPSFGTGKVLVWYVV